MASKKSRGVRNTIEWVLDQLIPSENGCLVWHGTRNTHEYGQVSYKGRYRMVHRLVYETRVGPIPRGMVLHHVCKNPPCANPAHLVVMSPSEHLRLHGIGRPGYRKTHCIHGHKMDEANTHVTKRGFHQCRACGRAKEERKRRAAGVPTRNWGFSKVSLCFGGETRLLLEWAKATGISYNTICDRYSRGWPVEKILRTPPQPNWRTRLRLQGMAQEAADIADPKP